LGLSGRVPPRVDAATKAGLLALLEDAVDQGWTVQAACAALELGQRRAWRWLDRRAAERLEDLRPGGGAVHGLLEEEVAEIICLFHQWGEIDRSHRKLAHRGSYLGRVWVSPSSVRRVLDAEACGCGHCHDRRAASASRSRTGSSTGPGCCGSSTPPTSPAPGWPRP
jgi:putative transposase